MRRFNNFLPMLVFLTLILTVLFGILSYDQLRRLNHLVQRRYLNFRLYSPGNHFSSSEENDEEQQIEMMIDDESKTGSRIRSGENAFPLTNRSLEAACVIPMLDIYHDDVKKFVQYKPPAKCDVNRISYIENDTLFVTEPGIEDAGFYYINRKPGDDFETQLSPWISMFKPRIVPLSRGTSGCLVPIGRKESVFVASHWFILAEGDECTFLKLLRFTEEGLIRQVISKSCLDCIHKDYLAFNAVCAPEQPAQLFRFEEEGSVIRSVGTGLCIGIVKNTAVLVNCERAQRFYMLVHKEKIFSSKLKEEFIMVRMQKGDVAITEYHAHVLPPPEPSNFQHPSDASLNIAMVMYDSQSHSNVKRHMNITYGYLRAHPDTFIFDGMTVVGDGTTAQVAAHLTGVAEAALPEARRGVQDSKTVDRFPFIFKVMKEAGYISAFSEDDPWGGAFTYRLKGFRNSPCEKYLRPFWLEALKHLAQKEVACIHQLNLSYLRKLFDVYREVKKFAYMTNARCCHDDIARISYADQDTYDLYQYFDAKGYLNNTIVILFGDHGDRSGEFRATLTGKLEERLPFFAMTVPGWFKTKYPRFYENLRRNQNVLTTHYDVYATLRHIINLRAPPRKYHVHTGKAESLFTRIDRSTRTCSSAGIENHWCPCLLYDQVSVKDKHISIIATELISYMNKLLCSAEESCNSCSSLSLTNITRAGKSSPYKDVIQFASTKKSDLCDSCGILWNSGNKATTFLYELVVEVAPSSGLFEASAQVQFAASDLDKIERISINPVISRVNRYNDQPWCIEKRLPHLRNFCFCKSRRKT